ncbi:MAG: hypothetical protein V4490_05445 [Pseudomonadota bacterium]
MFKFKTPYRKFKNQYFLTLNTSICKILAPTHPTPIEHPNAAFLRNTLVWEDKEESEEKLLSILKLVFSEYLAPYVEGQPAESLKYAFDFLTTTIDTGASTSDATNPLHENNDTWLTQLNRWVWGYLNTDSQSTSNAEKEKEKEKEIILLIGQLNELAIVAFKAHLTKKVLVSPGYRLQTLRSIQDTFRCMLPGNIHPLFSCSKYQGAVVDIMRNLHAEIVKRSQLSQKRYHHNPQIKAVDITAPAFCNTPVRPTPIRFSQPKRATCEGDVCLRLTSADPEHASTAAIDEDVQVGKKFLLRKSAGVFR